MSLFVPSAEMLFTPKCRCSPVVLVPVLPEIPSCWAALTVSPTLTLILSRCIYTHWYLLPSSLSYSTVTDLPPPVLVLWLTATTFPRSSVASTASCFVCMSMPLCICCLLLSIGSFRIPKGEVISINSSRLNGKKYCFSSFFVAIGWFVVFACTSEPVVLRGFVAVPNCLPWARISAITIWSYF